MLKLHSNYFMTNIFMQAFLLNLDNVAFSIFGFKIYWYGIAYMIGISICYLYMKFLNKKYHFFSEQLLEDILFFTVCGIIIGGRLGFCIFYDISKTISDPINILRIREGGMSFHGGMIGVIISTIMLSKKHKTHYLKITDIIAVVTPIGLFFGRIANFINQESIGIATNSSWGVIFSKIDLEPRYPTQLIEALIQGPILLLIMLNLIKKHLHTGALSYIFLIYYGLTRSVIELLKEQEGEILSMNVAILLCTSMWIIGCILFYQSKSKRSFF